MRRTAAAPLLDPRVLTAWVLTALALAAPPLAAKEYSIDPAHSVFAVLTHKAGIGSALAHDHLVVAPKPAAKLDFDPEHPEATQFSFTVAVDSLEIDAPAPRAAWKERFKALGIHSGDLPLVSDGDRAKVRIAMLGESQLNSAKFPEIRAELLALERRTGGSAGGSSVDGAGWNVKVRLTAHGKTVERALPASWSEKDGTLTAEIVGEFHFKELGIEPYSTMLGAIRNDDLFHLFVSVVAHPAP